MAWKELIDGVVAKNKDAEEELIAEFTEPVAHKMIGYLVDEGVLAKDTHGSIIRFTPPLIITDDQVYEAFSLIRKAFKKL